MSIAHHVYAAYAYSKVVTAAGKRLANAQAATACAAVTKSLKKVSYKVLILPEKTAPVTSIKSPKGQSFRVNIAVVKR